MGEININSEITSKKFWSQLFRLASKYYSIDWIKYKGKNYFNCETIWDSPEEIIERMKLLNIKPCHKNYKCECGESDICDNYKKYNKTNTNINEVKYIFSDQKLFGYNIEDLYSQIYYEDDSESESESEFDFNTKIKTKNYSKISKVILAILDEDFMNPTKIKLVSDKSVIIYNPCGFNHDHRGSDHTLLKLPWVEKVNLGKEFTLYDLLTGYYNLKSHKFDNNYELFCDASSKLVGDSIQVKLYFDHGS